jgi:hypothetical protein
MYLTLCVNNAHLQRKQKHVISNVLDGRFEISKGWTVRGNCRIQIYLQFIQQQQQQQQQHKMVCSMEGYFS